MNAVEGVSRVVKRPRPDSDVVVCAISRDGGLVRIDGLAERDYLTTPEALDMARALVAAVDELAPPS
jgi:hypothetical protein